MELLTCLDPGHGGNDPGTRGAGGTLEKDMALDIALRVRAYLGRKELRCLMTRAADEAVSLERRAAVANAAGANLFLSIHLNGFSEPTPIGIETWHFPGSESGRRLAVVVQDLLPWAGGFADRGTKQGRFYVLRHTTMPAVLVELGFLTSPDDERRIRAVSTRDKLAFALATGVRRYYALM